MRSSKWLVFIRPSLAGFDRPLTGTGFWVLSKRLEEGTFSWPKNLEPQITKLKLTPQALAMLTDGVDLRGGKLRPWYEREE